MSAPAVERLGDLTETTAGGKLRPMFHQGQRLAYWSDARRTLVLAGTQGGKTVVGPWWLLRQMRAHGPGDYIVAGPELTLLRKKVIPSIVELFSVVLDAGSFTTSPDAKFVVSARGARVIFGESTPIKTTIWFGHGDDPDSLESMTAKAAWLDEPGQKKFQRESYEAIERRLAIEDGPILLTTTPYVLHWLKLDLYDRRDDPSAGVRVIGFDSIANPRFPRVVWERARATLPSWKFNMFYRGRFERPAGLIYGCFDAVANVCPTFAIPSTWPRFVGCDFGGVNTAALKLAAELSERGEPTGRFFAYDEYLAGGKTAAQHATSWQAGESALPTAIGGSRSEGQWRLEFAAARFPIWDPPISDVEVGIDRLFGLVQERRLIVMTHLRGTLEQFSTYSRELDASGEPTAKIEDKERYHYLDALRYFAAFVTQPARRFSIS